MSLNALSSPKYYEQAIAVRATKPSSWSKVKYVKYIKVDGAGKKDKFAIESKGSISRGEIDPIILKGSGKFPVNYPDGRIRVVPLSVKNPITVLALCER